MTDDDAKKIEADEADEAGVWVVGEISKERVITVPNVAAVEAEIERLRALVTSTRAEADAATQRAAEGELAARTVEARLTAALDQAESSLSDTIAEAERGTTYRIELQRTIDRLTARLQTVEKLLREREEDAARPALTLRERVAEALADCPACGVDDVPEEYPATLLDLAALAAHHGVRGEGLAGGEETALRKAYEYEGKAYPAG